MCTICLTSIIDGWKSFELALPIAAVDDAVVDDDTDDERLLIAIYASEIRNRSRSTRVRDAISSSDTNALHCISCNGLWFIAHTGEQ